MFYDGFSGMTRFYSQHVLMFFLDFPHSEQIQ